MSIKFYPLLLVLALGSAFAQTPSVSSGASSAASASLGSAGAAGATGSTGAPNAANTANATGQGLTGKISDAAAADANTRMAAKADTADKASNAALRLPDLESTEFQSYVEQSTGRKLPLFGYQLFGNALGNGNRFAPVPNTPVPANYVLGPGDEVALRVWGAQDADLRLAIDANGQVSIPKLGVFSLLGVKASELEGTLRSQLAKNFTNFQLSATVGKLRSMQIYVVGQARQPGAHLVSGFSTLVSALFELGGPSSAGSLRNIQLKRNGRVLSTIDLYEFLSNGDKSADLRLLPDDVIVIPPAGARVAVFGGAVDTPAIYELKGAGDTVQSVLNTAGGKRVLTSQFKLQLERINPAQAKAPRTVISLALDPAGLANTLQDGDLLTLFSVASEFANAVTLRGNVALPLRYPYKGAMTLADLIPDRDAVLTGDYFARKNIQVQFDVPGGSSGKNASQDRVLGEIRNIVDEPNWDYALIERLDRSTLRTELIPFDLGKVVRKQMPDAGIALQSGDVVTIFSVKDVKVPRAKTAITVKLEGEFNRPGIYSATAGESLRDVIDRAGGLTPDAYVFGTEFYRDKARADQQANLKRVVDRLQSQLLAASDQNAQSSVGTDAQLLLAKQQAQQRSMQAQLERLRSLKATGRVALALPALAASNSVASYLPGLRLENGDHIVMPARPDFVQVYGSVNLESSLIWKPGSSLQDYLQQAGPTQFADREQVFVIRADGSVASRSDGLFSRSMSGLEILPGDNIVVPEMLDKETRYATVIRNLKDFSVIFQGFGIGAAAFKALGY